MVDSLTKVYYTYRLQFQNSFKQAMCAIGRFSHNINFHIK